MKFLKLYEQFDWNEDDFDEEENDFSEHEKQRSKYHNFWALRGKTDKLSNITYTELLKEIKRIKKVSKHYEGYWLKKFLDLLNTELEYRKANPNR